MTLHSKPDPNIRVSAASSEDRLYRHISLGPLDWQLGQLPLTTFVGANRYDTDDEHVLHLWTSDGQSFDIRWLRDPSQTSTGVDDLPDEKQMPGSAQQVES